MYKELGEWFCPIERCPLLDASFIRGSTVLWCLRSSTSALEMVRCWCIASVYR